GTGADGSVLFINWPRHASFEKYGDFRLYASTDGVGFAANNAYNRNSQVFSAYCVTPRSWMRVKHYFDYTDAGNPGRLLYSAFYDITAGVERRVAERRPDETPVLGM